MCINNDNNICKKYHRITVIQHYMRYTITSRQEVTKYYMTSRGFIQGVRNDDKKTGKKFITLRRSKKTASSGYVGSNKIIK